MPWHVSMLSVMYQRIGNMPKACPYVMMNRKLEIHILCVLWCVFFGVMWMVGSGKMIWGM